MCDTVEQWKMIEGFPDYYVSTLGRVFSLKRFIIMKPSTNGNGYVSVSLSNSLAKRTRDIHRLVALAFIENPEEKKYVDHKNNIQDDNQISNLRWATASQNGQNSKIKKNNTCGVKGITYIKKTKKYRVRIYINGKRIHLGNFKTLEEAQFVRTQKAQEAFGDFVNACERI